MANELAMFQQGAIPAHVQAFLDTNEGNIQDRVSVPSISIKGKVWAIRKDGETTKMEMLVGGERVPAPVLSVVILDYAKKRGRAFFKGDYDPDNTSQPDCWSDDGVLPASDVADKQASKCDGCPMSIKGSKATSRNAEGIACSSHRLLAVVPANNLDYTPLRLKIAVTSDYDKTGADKLKAEGWYAFQQYTDMLKANGVKDTRVLVTKMKFDADAEFPKIIFSNKDWLTPEQTATLERVKVEKADVIAALISTGYTVNGADGVQRGQVEPGEDTETAKQEAAKKAEAKRKADEAAKAKADADAKAEAVRKAAEDGEGEIILPGEPSPAADAAKPVKAAKAATKKAAPAADPGLVEPEAGASGGDDNGLGDILTDWED